jgi:UDP-N-acetylmuramoyl-L-alanyl-D-glutamate--2,6-diaminopimelate ligase
MRIDALLGALRDVTVTLDDPRAGRIEVTSVVHDSRLVGPGALFCCVPGSAVDGHDLVDDAARAGAAALLVERGVPSRLPRLRVPSVRQALGPVAAAFWGRPSESLAVVGVTGTSGKTTTTHLLGSVFEVAGWPASVLGTLSGARTTPEAPELQARLAAALDAGQRAVAMEVSSHALAMDRVRSTRFRVAVFTNLSHDHLDFHHDLEDYFEAKARLFTPDYSDLGVINVDDPRGEELVHRGTIPMVPFSFDDATELEVSPTSTRFRWRGQRVDLPMGGRFNVSNALAAATAAVQLGLEPEVVAAGLSRAARVPGRFEPVDEGQPFTVVVDYAHKPGALAGVLDAARDAADGRVLLVIGAGGDRDRTKWPEMGAVAAKLADHVVLTSDNPRREDPQAIIDAIRAGMPPDAPAVVEPDRSTAIAAALDEALPGDVVVIAGKGHETVQVIGDAEIDFDDREVARAALRALRGSGRW